MCKVHPAAVQNKKILEVLLFGFERFLTLFAQLDINDIGPFIGVYKIFKDKKLI